MKKETQEVRGLRRALAEAYLSERAARKKELVAIRAKEEALRQLQKMLGERLNRAEARLELLAKAEPKHAGPDLEMKKAVENADDRLKELEWKIEWLDYPGKKKKNLYLSS